MRRAWTRGRDRPTIPFVALVALVTLASSGCAWITWASVNTTGGAANGHSFNPAISADGRYVAFTSRASDLIGTDGNRRDDVFVRDLRGNRTVRASVNTTGGGPNGSSSFPAISGDGRFVAFSSTASNLVPNDGNRQQDVFVRDMIAGTTTRVSVDTAGGDAAGRSQHASMTADGHTIAFESSASGLVAADGNSTFDVFVRDMQAGVTTRVSVDVGGGDPNANSHEAAITPNGRFVAFYSVASDLVPDDGNGFIDAFVRDLATNTTERVSVNSAGDEGDGDIAGGTSISADGRHVAFVSDANNLVPGDGGGRDIFVRDRQTDVTTRISTDVLGGDPDGNSNEATISGDGRFVAFASLASDLVPGDTNATGDVFVRDRQTGVMRRVSVGALGEQSGWSDNPAISTDGRYVVFAARPPKPVPGADGDPSLADIYVRFVVTPTVASVAPSTVARGTTAVLHVTGFGFVAPVTASVGLSAGVTVNSVTVTSDSALNVSVSVAADAAIGPRDLTVVAAGTGPGLLAGAAGFCSACLTVS